MNGPDWVAIAIAVPLILTLPLLIIWAAKAMRRGFVEDHPGLSAKGASVQREITIMLTVGIAWCLAVTLAPMGRLWIAIAGLALVELGAIVLWGAAARRMRGKSHRGDGG